MGFLNSVKRFGSKIASNLEGSARFGQKVLNSGARLGNKLASGIDSVASAVGNLPILGAVSNIPIPRVNMSAQQLASAGAGAIRSASNVASAGANVLGQGANLVRTGRGLMETGNPVAVAKDMMRQGRSIADASRSIGQQIQRFQ